MQIRSAFLAAVASTLLTTSAFGQACYAENPGNAFNNAISMGGPNLLLGVKFTPSITSTVTRIEVFTGEGTGTNSVELWSHDAVNNQPLTQLGAGSWSMSSTNSWQGANLTTSVSITNGTTYWMVWGCVNGSQASVDVAMTSLGQPYRGSFNAGTSWSGPFQFNDRHWKFQLFCGNPCLGSFTRYGAACPGTNNRTPIHFGTGCPTWRGSITWEVGNGLPGASGVLGIGVGTTAFTLYPGCVAMILPLVTTIPIVLNGSGALSLPIGIPPGVGTFNVYTKAFLLDVGAPFGVSGSNDLQTNIQ